MIHDGKRIDTPLIVTTKDFVRRTVCASCNSNLQILKGRQEIQDKEDGLVIEHFLMLISPADSIKYFGYVFEERGGLELLRRE